MNKLNIGMVGHGMMGTWHSEALQDRDDCVLHTLVGKDATQAASFAARFGYRQSTADFAAAIADPAIDAVIIASPSEDHAWMARAVIAQGKPVLVEIPLAMSLAACQDLVDRAEAAGVMLAVCHPMRFRNCRAPLIERIRQGTETPVQIHGRFFIHRLENIGATGLKRDWTDNILWHHMAHLVDIGLFLASGDPIAAEPLIARIEGFMPRPSARTRIPMDIAIAIELATGCTILANGSYHARERLYEVMTVTDQDSYRVDEIAATMTTGAGPAPIATERENAWLVARDFVGAVRHRQTPFVTARSVLPAMRVLETVQTRWDARFGATALPGRPL